MKMIESYKKVLEMKLAATNDLKEDMNQIDKILYDEKNFIIKKLIAYLKQELHADYTQYTIEDYDGNRVELLAKKDSKLFQKEIADHEYLECNAEELIDSRLVDNTDEIIIVELDSESALIDLSYLCESLEYNYLSYSTELKEKLSIFMEYVISKKII